MNKTFLLRYKITVYRKATGSRIVTVVDVSHSSRKEGKAEINKYMLAEFPKATYKNHSAKLIKVY